MAGRAASMKRSSGGYRRPPEETQFQVGNNFGSRPRKPKRPDIDKEFSKVLNERIHATVNGTPQVVTIAQAILLSLVKAAFAGEEWALPLVEKLVAAFPPNKSDDDDMPLWESVPLTTYIHLDLVLQDSEDQNQVNKDGN